MPSNVVHFAIHADDVDRAREFYERVFSWRFEAWGPPDFYLVQTGTEAEPGIRGALQARQAPVEGDGMIGFECTVGVDDVDAIAAAVEEHGGTILMPRATIPTVGDLIKFKDTEGNVLCAMQYLPGVA